MGVHPQLLLSPTLFNHFSQLSDQGSTQDVVDVVLDTWLSLVQMMSDTLPRSPLDVCMLRIVDCYVKCHLAPPAGIRNDSADLVEVCCGTLSTGLRHDIGFRGRFLKAYGKWPFVRFKTATVHCH